MMDYSHFYGTDAGAKRCRRLARRVGIAKCVADGVASHNYERYVGTVVRDIWWAAVDPDGCYDKTAATQWLSTHVRAVGEWESVVNATCARIFDNYASFVHRLLQLQADLGPGTDAGRLLCHYSQIYLCTMRVEAPMSFGSVSPQVRRRLFRDLERDIEVYRATDRTPSSGPAMPPSIRVASAVGHIPMAHEVGKYVTLAVGELLAPRIGRSIREAQGRGEVVAQSLLVLRRRGVELNLCLWQIIPFLINVF